MKDQLIILQLGHWGLKIRPYKKHQAHKIAAKALHVILYGLKRMLKGISKVNQLPVIEEKICRVRFTVDFPFIEPVVVAL